MKSSQVLLLGVAALLLYMKYVPPSISPTPIDPVTPHTEVVVLPDTNFPSAPSSPQLKSLAEQLLPILSQEKEDAMALASAYRSWADLIARDEQLKNTQQLRDVYKSATIAMFIKTNLAGKYQGKIDTIVEQMVISNLKSQGLETGYEIVSLTPPIRQSMKEVLEAVSWACYTAFQAPLL